MIAAVISGKVATLHECETIYSVEDIYLMLEIMAVDAHNRRAAVEDAKRRQER